MVINKEITVSCDEPVLYARFHLLKKHRLDKYIKTIGEGECTDPSWPDIKYMRPLIEIILTPGTVIQGSNWGHRYDYVDIYFDNGIKLIRVNPKYIEGLFDGDINYSGSTKINRKFKNDVNIYRW